MIELRRKFLKGGASAALLSPLLGTGLLIPTSVLAADWNKNAFSARNVSEALKAYGSANAADSRDITINAPEIAENGAKVEVEISSNIANTRSLAIFADKNPMPMCSAIEFSGPVLPYVRAQLKLSETTRIRAVAKNSDGKSYVAFREIKVTLGGCGG
ncbi:thiosulfate oxidation carrier protein SoxY [Ferribacterium limneticum]|uniref:thiosulfate oxidation carrier protein SoxY n=1 Tax=Ferribacterium limneticum TaxID=76259 RepID=UPI001CFC2ECA|nr:thiosulfate oxidation carrier protein SoxY [Ferribacterium limneticum]UCV29574.1 thiosulfate oxidation carrier protein SoxY [Ferribacterium limneticum]UCV33493.1 thiosulfate oxidation carrier protein SoxY [Ferribacterium limneticum]